MKIDSITIDSKKLKILEHDESKLICSFMNANPGTFKIKLYQNEKEFILKKDIHFIQMEYKEPSKDNIYFLPDTIYLQENNPEIEFTLYGSDFEQYKIDKVYLNSQQCWIVKEFRDSLQVQCQYSLLGNTTISFLYKGTKNQS